jgi:hypothetical protein|tara:strand:+ start:329 stop:532 length:204 start_codon:yes stop_codon:yes gene_type:complete
MNHKNKLIETLMLYKNGKAIDSDIIRAIEKSYVEILLFELECLISSNSNITLKDRILNKIEELKKEI